MNSFFEDVAVPILAGTGTVMFVAALLFGIAVALSSLAANWNCSSWHATTGEETKVIAADCYVKSGDKWELFSTRVKNHHVEVKP